MVFKIYLDPGHGGSDPGASGNGIEEKNITLDIALRIRDILLDEYEGVEVKLSRATDTYIGLETRTDEANTWGADYFLSIHCNSFNGSAHGYEDYIYIGLSDASSTAKYQDIIHEEVASINQLTERGTKKADFHVLRESSMPALLTENGYIDNDHDAALMKKSSWRQSVARGHVNGLARAFHLKRKTKTERLYKVLAGSFKSRKNAQTRVTFLQSKGIDAMINRENLSDHLWYRVQAGAFRSKENAKALLVQVKRTGIADAYISEENGQ
ncbi:N-acetylmuramoyl-L-alanine amidase [Camelliibacillus cellulosilyticus]|uniref:N-acetylmuramoyl-L-alanine amidase n=1 Tax=Camelliibacillus cellulosilyticus TaxID=2174486 RepID=A0ABV9GTG6_9BACL